MVGPADFKAQFDREYVNAPLDRVVTRLAQAFSGAHDHADALARLGVSHTAHTAHAATHAERDFRDP